LTLYETGFVTVTFTQIAWRFSYLANGLPGMAHWVHTEVGGNKIFNILLQKGAFSVCIREFFKKVILLKINRFDYFKSVWH
jgi:hypothetical protein